MVLQRPRKPYSRKTRSKLVVQRSFKQSDKPRVQCPQCPSTVGREYDLKRHMLLHLRPKAKDKKSYHCSLCPFKALQKKNWEHHFNVYHDENPKIFWCLIPGCDFEGLDPSSYTTHCKLMHDTRPSMLYGTIGRSKHPAYDKLTKTDLEHDLLAFAEEDPEEDVSPEMDPSYAPNAPRPPPPVEVNYPEPDVREAGYTAKSPSAHSPSFVVHQGAGVRGGCCATKSPSPSLIVRQEACTRVEKSSSTSTTFFHDASTPYAVPTLRSCTWSTEELRAATHRHRDGGKSNVHSSGTHLPVQSPVAAPAKIGAIATNGAMLSFASSFATEAKRVVLPPCSSLPDPMSWVPPPPQAVASLAPLMALASDVTSGAERRNNSPGVFASSPYYRPEAALSHGHHQAVSYYRMHTGV
ncbi:hypothetical protein PUNSTDRAFT_146334 [Punctularia strigosozonata HHB-11173 SS5]|uniref:C2H2-type domain-containing protein n=1 Tax=Punctularia strigosozonata (strain HHB-11173) TaxID=741275 RepID=R7S2R6_PUNST|nr:uncharacterized protein PUNSTDRAFT_146334 [Punctularia strigosozonata HHB-11173 SS5]EIN04675.1 hypothetical protein PUNSTDRAFT_146334 [Punctularia strigosozonata HHB-11173 SS5]